ncbi:MAG: ribonuclease III [Eubacteriales bacterium]|nr:ribonuclease III [Eubacteriales bacterium]
MAHYEDPRRLEAAIGYEFADIGRLTLALTHSSYSNELPNGDPLHTLCNERLEFLGDSVLQLISGEYLFTGYPDRPEGALTKLRSDAVCEDALCGYARKLELGRYLRLGRGEESSNGRERRSILADAFEAVLAALYLDAAAKGSDPLTEARRFVLPFLQERIRAHRGTVGDCKTALQQLVQSTEGERLEYVTVSESGPDHCKVFEVEARLDNNVIGKGKGSSRREAEQHAAREALVLFGEYHGA